MAGHWCWRCPMLKSKWSASANAVIPPEWTLESLQAHCLKLQNGELDKNKSEQVRGVKEQALWCIPVRNSLAPSLHNNEVFVNEPMKLLMCWINHRIEQLPLELIEARLTVIDLLIDREAAIESLAEATAPLASSIKRRSQIPPSHEGSQRRQMSTPGCPARSGLRRCCNSF